MWFKKPKEAEKPSSYISLDTRFSHQDTEKLEMKKASRRYFSVVEDGGSMQVNPMLR